MDSISKFNTLYFYNPKRVFVCFFENNSVSGFKFNSLGLFLTIEVVMYMITIL